MSLLQKIKADQLAARKSKDVTTASLLTTLIGEIQTISKNEGNRDVTDSEVTAIIQKFRKNLNELISGCADKPEYADNVTKAKAEFFILEEYLPQQMTGAALEFAIKTTANTIGATKKSDMGKLMQAFKAQFDGQYDGKEASNIVKSILI